MNSENTSFALRFAKEFKAVEAGGKYDPGLEIWLARGAPIASHFFEKRDSAATTFTQSTTTSTTSTTTTTTTSTTNSTSSTSSC